MMLTIENIMFRELEGVWMKDGLAIVLFAEAGFEISVQPLKPEGHFDHRGKSN